MEERKGLTTPKEGRIGTLHRLPVRDVFSHEAYDFTTWMEDNPDALSSAVGIELADVKREHNAGDFSVDLFAEDEDGHRVIIENQLEATDHKHLGQVLTYLSVLDADVAIWIAADARPEHVSAVSWLNENATGADFYLVKVEGIRVDDSRAAPLFTRIVGPSEETRAAGQTKKELVERERLRKEFFTGLLPVSNAKTDRFAKITPKPRNHVSASAGNGFDFGYRLNEHESRAFLFIHFGPRTANDAAFEELVSHRDEIESAVGDVLEWVQDENRRRMIRYVADGGYRDTERWESLYEELAEAMAHMEAAIIPYLSDARRAASQAMSRTEA